MLIWLASYPRSGNTFFRLVLHRLYAVRSTNPYVASKGATMGPSGLLPRIPDLTLADMAAAAEVFFVKTHDLPGPDRHRAVYLVRDGRDALVSYAHFVLIYERGLPPEAADPALFRRTLSDLMLERRSPFGTWAANVDAWLARPGTLVVRFEDLVADPARWAGHVVESLALPVVPTGQLPPTFDELHGAWPRFFRRGRVGAWRDEFPPELLGLFWREFGPTMRRLGYA